MVLAGKPLLPAEVQRLEGCSVSITASAGLSIFFGQFVDMKPPPAGPKEDGVHRFYLSCFLFILLVPPTAITVGFSLPKFPTTFYIYYYLIHD